MKTTTIIFVFLTLYAVVSFKSSASASSATCVYERSSYYNSWISSNPISGYMCTLNVINYGNQVTQIRGTHQNRLRDINVDIINVSGVDQSYLTSYPGIFCKKFINLKLIDMSDVKMQTIEDGSLDQCRNLRILLLEINKIEVLPENFLAGQTLLTILDLSWNRLTQIPSGTFDDLNSLKKLNLDGNQLKKLDKNLFKNVQNLETLYLNHIDIADLPNGIFTNLHNLKNLYMEYNKLTTIRAASFPQNAHIDVISLTSNQIEAIDEAFVANCRVVELNMDGNVCARDTQVRNYQMRQKLHSCFRNYRDLNTRTTTSTPQRASSRPAKNKLTPWIQGCGRAKVGTQTIIGGTKVNKGTHPWIAALADNTKGYICGGTLITKRLVVTAAHCILDKSHESKPEDITVILGAHELDNPLDIGKRSYAVKSIHPHDHWNPHTDKFDADIAVLRLTDDVVFGTYIQPACLPKIGKNFANFPNGIVIGFGRTETSDQHSNVPMKANTPIHNSDDCYSEFPHLLNIASRRTFCGGYANGTGSCTGDSGGGLTVVQDDVNYLRGIVSASLHGTDYGCDVQSYAIFTDIKFYLDFIKQFNN